jgi:hypothetical protein
MAHPKVRPRLKSLVEASWLPAVAAASTRFTEKDFLRRKVKLERDVPRQPTARAGNFKLQACRAVSWPSAQTLDFRCAPG